MFKHFIIIIDIIHNNELINQIKNNRSNQQIFDIFDKKAIIYKSIN